MSGRKSRDWCILRTAGPRTLPLARSLADAGFEAWTPIFVERRRKPRSKAITETDTAGMPTFVFVPDRYRADLLRLLLPHAPNPHPPFSLFRYYGAVVTIEDRELHRLRSIEADRKLKSDERLRRATRRLKQHGEPFGQGETVRFATGALAGISAMVEESDGRRTRVTLHLFGRISQVEVETSQLRGELLSSAQPEQGAASHMDA
jgi:hypothetical protein